MTKPSIISSDTKIPVKDILYIIAFVWFLAGIKSEIKELRAIIDGRLNLYEFRLDRMETSQPGSAKKALAPPAAITPRALTSLSDITDDE